MSLRKAIRHGKEHRRYPDGGTVERTHYCRVERFRSGDGIKCDYCRRTALFQTLRIKSAIEADRRAGMVTR